MNTPAIEAIGLGRDYGSTRALEALDLAVPAGAIVGLVGPNGAGKTTTMLLLSTLLSPSRGEARLFGLDITRHRTAIRRRLGLVFQEPSIDGLLTVEENLLFAARLAGLSGAPARRAVSDLVTRTGLTDRRSQPARTLSAGWRRLTDLARAILHRPQLLLLDEPTVALDPEHRERAWTLLETERREHGTTIVFSTHYLAEAEVSDRVVLLAGGRLVGADTPAALRASLGDEIIEIEGPDTPHLLDSLRQRLDVRAAIRTERGHRIGIAGRGDALAQLGTLGSGHVRLAIRPVTLDDVYFALTQVPGATASTRTAVPAPARAR